MGRGARAAAASILSLGLAFLVGISCADEPEGPPERPAAEVESLTRSAPEEIRYELENVGHEIHDLEALLESGAVRAEPDSAPAERLAEARSAYRGALDALADSDVDRATDSLERATERVETVKRSLGLAEEFVEPLDADSVPVTVPEDLTS